MAWRLDTRMLRMIVALADARSAAEAAHRLNITASALSHQLRNTEEMLRVRLFDRKQRRILLTPLGEQVLAAARIIVGELDRTEDLLERSRRSDRPSVRVSGGPYPIHSWFLDSSAKERNFWPEIDFVQQQRSQSLGHAIASGDLDLAFTCSGPQQAQVKSVPLFRDELVAVFPQSNGFGARQALEAVDLANHVYITYSRVVESGLEDDLLFRPARIAPTMAREAQTVEAILALVAAGAGFTILSRWAVMQHPSREHLSLYRLTTTGLNVTWSALMRDGDQNAGTLLRIVEFIRESSTLQDGRSATCPQREDANAAIANHNA